MLKPNKNLITTVVGILNSQKTSVYSIAQLSDSAVCINEQQLHETHDEWNIYFIKSRYKISESDRFNEDSLQKSFVDAGLRILPGKNFVPHASNLDTALDYAKWVLSPRESKSSFYTTPLKIALDYTG